MTSESESRERVERFRTLYLTNYRSVLGYTLRRTSTDEDAADVLAETFLVLWRRLDDAPAGAETKPWLYGIARRVVANKVRSERRRERLSSRLAAPQAQGAARSDDMSSLVSEAMRQLSSRDREVLRLFAWEDLTIDEIASVVGCSTNAAKVRLHRARRRLAPHLEHLGLGTFPSARTDDELDEAVTHIVKEELG